MKPLKTGSNLTRDDIRQGRVKRVPLDADSESPVEPPVDEAAATPVKRFFRKRPMGGFLSSDVMRRQRR